MSPQKPRLETGRLPERWPAATADWHAHEYNPHFYILRESPRVNFEKPFVYLIFGREAALLIDTGSGAADLAGFVSGLVAERGVRLVVAHSHGHGDHVAGDAALRRMPGVTFIPATVEAACEAFGIGAWPESAGAIDLGGRTLDVIPIPGHHPSHVAFYDRATGILLTGDHLYPGRLYVYDFAAYLASTRRLVEFTETRPVAHVLGCHVEQTATPFADYPEGTLEQPEEHGPALGRAHLLELAAALEAMRGKPGRSYHRDFTIWPA